MKTEFYKWVIEVANQEYNGNITDFVDMIRS